MRRANRTAIERTETGAWRAVFYKTHDRIAEYTDPTWTAPADAKNTTAQREAFRKHAIEHAEEVGVDWKPEYQQQAWNRRYWKYENEAQIEEDAVELMAYTINKTCQQAFSVEIHEISLDSVVPVESPLKYVVNGKYEKNGNWASAQVNLSVKMLIDGAEIDIIWAIEMVSGQLKKIKLTRSMVKEMIEESIA